MSATPLAIKPVLLKLGVPETQIAELHETITESGRPLHGDVRLVLESMASMPELLAQHVGQVAEEVAQNRQVVVIYNALADFEA